jgi:hypothetical protein
MSARPSTAERLDRLDRVLWLLAQRAGIGRPGLGPMDPGWQRLGHQAELDLAAIAQEQAEAQLETRGAAV